MAIKVKKIPIKTHNSVKKVEQYYTLLCHTYKIISSELEDTSKKLILQMAVKAVNNSAGLDGLIPMLLVFGTYF